MEALLSTPTVQMMKLSSETLNNMLQVTQLTRTREPGLEPRQAGDRPGPPPLGLAPAPAASCTTCTRGLHWKRAHLQHRGVTAGF